MLKKIIGYMKDNPRGYWFKRKIYGWGWLPVRWQGWLVIAGFIAFIFVNSLLLAKHDEPTAADIAWFFINLAIAITTLIVICYKTGEKPGWQWGIPKKEPSHE